MRLKSAIILFSILFLADFAAAQPCGSTVPVFNVNLTGTPSGTWTSPSVTRNGSCCGDNNCVSIIITLDPGAAGFSFNSSASAGSYQVNCGSLLSIGSPACISGIGPHKLSYCKPGNNPNTYTITSIARAVAGSDLSVNNGCTRTINASGFNVSSTVWKSIYPGALGAYNNYLSCTSGCQTPAVTATGTIPPYVDYQICGVPAGLCNFGTVCDTVRIFFPPALAATIAPQNPTICFGQTSTTINASATGGTPPYTYLWNNVNPSQSLLVGNGTYQVKVADASGCPPATASVTVTSFTVPITANAGADKTVCKQNPITTINGSVTGASGGKWSGGLGTFSPNNTTLSGATYTPTPAELAAGFADLTLTTTGTGTCPTATDVVRINYVVFTGTVSFTQTQISCFGGNDGTATVNVSGGNYPTYAYSWNTAPIQSGATASNLSLGTYSVTISNGIGCTTTQPVTTTQPAPLALSSSITNVSCMAGNNGSVAITPTGGTAPYTYLWNTGSTASVMSGLVAQSYTVTVKDSRACQIISTYTVTQPTALSITFTSTPVSCFNGSNGTANSTVTGGTAPYTYNWSSGATSPDLSGVQAGTYSLTITDNKGCLQTNAVTITQPSIIVPTTSVTNETCDYSNNGTATAVASGGTPGYTYLWSNGGTSALISNLPSQTYTLTVTDLNGCTKTAFATITAPPALTINFISQVNVSCFGGNDGSVTASPAGGTPNYTYLWSGGGTAAGKTGLAAGTYTVTVTDSRGCVDTNAVTITQPTLLTTSATSTNESCNYSNNGTATAIPSGGTSGYTYLWQPTSQTTVTASTLSAGTHSLTVTDAKGCRAFANVTITEPTVLTVSFTAQTNVSCFAGSNGAVAANPAGGTAGYTYLWAPGGATSAAVTNLTAATYTVNITDSKGCTATNSVSITQPAVLITNPTVTNETCNDLNNGKATAAPSGGTPGYTYLWQPGALTASSINNLSSGTYTLTVTDALGCTAIVNPIIAEPAALVINFTSQIDVTCFGGNDASVTASPTGGTPNYSYLWAGGGVTAASRNNLAAGTYSVTVTDSRGCFIVSPVVITQPTAVTPNATITDETCGYLNNGTATAGASGGTPGYTYLWKPNLQTTGSITGLSAGTYTLIATDSRGCRGETNAVIAEPLPIAINFTAQTNVSCFAGSDGTVTASPSGGTPGYTYLWAPGGATGATLANLMAGTYSVIVTDNAGCTKTNNVVIAEPALLSASTTSTDETCAALNNGTAAAVPSGGTPGYTYLWSNGSTTSLISNLTAQSYSVTITDSKGCQETASATITEPPLLAVSFASQTNVSCFAGNDGNIAANPSGGTPNYSYLWTPGGTTTATITNLAAGTYSITITDSKGCTVTNSVAITQPLAPLAVSASSLPVTCYGSANGSVSAAAANGTGPYTYSWMPGNLTGQNVPNLAADTYTVTAIDSQGCIATAQVTITQPAQIMLTTSTVNANCGLANGQASVIVSGGIAPYAYLWSPAGGTNAVANNLPTGSYDVAVTDFAGCTVSQYANVSENSAPVLSIVTITNETCSGGSTGSAQVSTAGGVGPFTYSWLPFGGTNSLATGLTAGSYTVTVTDVTGCKSLSTTNPEITEPTEISIAVTTSPVSCFGGSDGTASAVASNGTPGYTYQWLPGGTTGLSVTNLSAVTYTVQVTDANGCVKTEPFTIIQPAIALSASLSSTPTSCFGGADGTASAIAANGTPPYNYNWIPGNINGPNISNLTGGTYTVTVTDAEGCSLDNSIDVTEPPPVLLSPSSIRSNCSLPNGQASVSVSGGTSPYQYQWFPSGGTAATAINLLAGTYTVLVTDVTACTYTAVITVNDNPAPIATVPITSNVSCFGGSDGTATVDVSSNAAGPFQYSWAPMGGTNSTATGLPTGTYTITVTDANSCQSLPAISALITEPSPIYIGITGTTVSCFGSLTGGASAAASGGTPGYTYLWLPSGTTGNSITNLSPNTYTIQVTDNKGCIETEPFIITQPSAPLSVSLSFTPGSCFGGTNGSVAAVAAGGTSSYNYTWMPGNINGATLSNLSSGTYTVSVVDARGCTVTDSITVTQPPAIALATDSTNSTCSLANGQASVVASGGVGSFSYLWSPTGGTAAIATGLLAGVYSIKVSDGNGCFVTKGITVNNNASPIATVALTTNVSCNTGSDGTATVSISGGTGPFTYSWMPSGNTDSIATGLLIGTHTVTVTDANSCQSLPAISPEITQPFPILITVTQTNVTCFGGNDGTAVAIASSGTPGYTYQWFPGGTTGSSISALSGNTYTVEVTDANSCMRTLPVIITEPNQLTATISSVTNVACNGGSDGTATATVNGGTAGYTYNWLPFGGNGVTGNGLSAGTVTVTVTDVSNCVSVDSAAITQPSLLSATGSGLSTSCFGGSNGSGVINAAGGTPVYSYVWTPAVSTNASASNLAAGNYAILVKDNNGCEANVSLAIAEPSALNGSLVSTNPSCGLSNGAISSQLSGGTLPYTYLWSYAAATTSAISGLGTGIFNLLVTDTLGCTKSLSANLSMIPNPTITISSITNTSCFGGNDGSATVNIAQGTAPYILDWAPSGGNALTASILSAATYTLTVTDAIGCQTIDSLVIAEPTAVDVSVSSLTDVLCNGGSTGAISVAAIGGTGPLYTYLWTPTGSTSSTAANLTVGTYTVTVMDQNNCVKAISASITEPTILAVSVDTIIHASCYDGFGSAILVTSGGTFPYNYSWTSPAIGQTGGEASNLSAASYTVTVTDTNGCFTDINIIIKQPLQVTTSTGPDDTICFGQTANLSASAIGGAGGYYYAWQPSGAITTGSLPATPASTTTYTVVAFDQLGCPGTPDTITAIVYNLTSANVQAIGNSPICPGQYSTIYVTTSGSTGPLTYQWDNNLGTSPGAFLLALSQPTNYIVTVTNSCGLSFNDTVVVLFNPQPTLSLTSDANSLCVPGTMPFFDNSITGNTDDPITSWLWNFGDGTTSTIEAPVHSYGQPGNYPVTLTVLTNGGCTSNNLSAPLTIDGYPTPTAAFTVSSTDLDIPYDVLICNNYTVNANTYLWSFGDGGTSSLSNPQYAYTSVGVFMVQLIAMNTYGCADTATAVITTDADVIFPNAFTPNPNGTQGGAYDLNVLNNDVFFPYSAGVIEFKLEIFNRWGEEIFESLDIKKGWDGYYKGTICQQDVYVWEAYVKLNNGKTFRKSGDLTLLRY